MTSIGNEDGTRTVLTAEQVMKISPLHSKGWIDNVPVSKEARHLLETYSGIAPDEVQEHVEELRKRAYKTWPYPCIGMGTYLEFTTAKDPLYPEILKRLKEGQTFLDAGCCFGQDIRRLLQDGAPTSANLYGIDINEGYFPIGKELFKDEDKLESQFFVCDLTETPPAALEQLRGKIDVISAQNLLHLFMWDQSKTAIKNLIAMSKDQPGSLLTGRQVGSKSGREHIDPMTGLGLFAQNEKTWREHWKEIMEETGTKWEITFQENNPSKRLAASPWWNEDLQPFGWSATRLA